MVIVRSAKWNLNPGPRFWTPEMPALQAESTIFS